MEEDFTYNSAWEDGYHYAQRELNLKWTNEPPTKPGFYWCKVKNEISVVGVSEWHIEELNKNVLVAELIGEDEKYIISENFSEVLWAGPLKEPEEKKDAD